ncbi:transcription termination factor MTERF8, chloroplastic [Spinacia oleracea]|uniref:Transcription termination factor MTERF8, chloroplastic n=1 Tax=Spinacia oleracea TaxID=3562 RepID=A0A9R0J1F3_SPIOL|nr:transcription termination factor MTERF8, chloroplastic [Spinacia oleracea]XP_056694485.1 transcription termination factor MTERF8, chloroplastic [Spinacia oleracea]
MVTLMSYAFNSQALSFPPQFSLHATHTVPHHLCFSLLKLTSSGFIGEKRALFWRISIQHSRNVFILSKSSRQSGDFTETGHIIPIFEVLGLDERVTQDILGRNPSLELLPVKLIRSRIHGLLSVGVNEHVLSRLISKYPDVLTAEEVGLLIEFIHDGLENKIESIQIERLLMGIEPRFIGGFDKKVNLLIQNGIPQEKIAHILNNVNLSKAICLKSCEEIQRLLSFLSRFDAVGILAKRPVILNYDLDTQLVPRIGFLQRLSGGDTDAVGEVLNRLPAIITYSVEHLQSQVEFFRSYVGLTDMEIFKIVLVFPNVMSASRQRKLQPRIDLLKECGLDSGEIYRFLIKAPLFLGLSFEKNLSHKLAMLVKIGYAHRTKDLAMGLGAVTRTSSENLQEVIDLFLSYGFSSDDIVAMSKKHFQILQYNPRSLEKKMEYLLEEMDREIGELLSFPAFLGYNLDNRIKHRYELKKKDAGDEMSLNKLLSVSTKKFSKTKKQLAEVSCSFGEEGADDML